MIDNWLIECDQVLTVNKIYFKWNKHNKDRIQTINKINFQCNKNLVCQSNCLKFIDNNNDW